MTTADCEHNGERSRKHRSNYAASDTGGMVGLERRQPLVARIRAKSTGAEDGRYAQKPRVRLEDQEGMQRVTPEDTAAAKSIMDAVFEAEANIQRVADAEQALIKSACSQKRKK